MEEILEYLVKLALTTVGVAIVLFHFYSRHFGREDDETNL